MLRTSQIIRELLQCEASNLSGGDHLCFKRSTRKKRPVTRDIHSNNNNNKVRGDNVAAFGTDHTVWELVPQVV